MQVFKQLHRRLPILITTVGLLFVLLLFGFNSLRENSSTFTAKESLPHLLNVIEMPNEVGTGEIAVIPGGYAYVLNWSGTVAVLDGAELVELIDLDHEHDVVSGDIVANPNDSLVFVSNSIDKVLYVISNTDVITDLVIAGIGPTELAVNVRANLVYVGGYNWPVDGPSVQSGVSVLNGTRVITHIPTINSPHALTVNENNGLLYAGLSLPSDAVESSLLTIIQNTEVLTRTDLDYDTTEMGSIEDIAINEQTGEVYMLQNLGTIVHKEGNKIERVRLGQMGYYPINFVAVDPTRNYAYVGIQNGPPSDLVILQGADIVTTLSLEYDSQFGIYDATHDYMYIANYRSGSISVVRGTDVIATLPTEGEGVKYIGLDEERGYIYVSNADSHSVAVFGFAEPEQPSLWQQFLPFLQR